MSYVMNLGRLRCEPRGRLETIVVEVDSEYSFRVGPGLQCGDCWVLSMRVSLE